jgi:cytochrome c biogenesis protein CcmG/thiol:disulfide interchange protein DsbE
VQLGNPFVAIGVDTAGRAAIEWGVYGVPETFLVGRDGIHPLQAGRPDYAG